jgi:adenylosuccinate synthase
MGNLSVVVGGQFGSEAKGAVAASLIGELSYSTRVINVRIGGSNAGHTVVGRGPSGEKHPWRLRHVPVGAVVDKEALLFLSAGSEVDLDVLLSEINELDQAGYEVSNRIFVDPQATAVEEAHHLQEKDAGLTAKLGSTSKGVGAARSARVLRDAKIIEDVYDPDEHPFMLANTSKDIHTALWDNKTHVVVEGTQGYGLGVHAGFYPFSTSADCRAVDFLSQAGISPWQAGIQHFEILVVARPNPIRVAGNSGPLEDETTWDALGLDEELTTVTKKVRRVGGWDAGLLRTAVRENGGAPTVKVALSMADHIYPELAGRSSFLHDPDDVDVDGVIDWVRSVEAEVEAHVVYVGTGPDSGIWIGDNDG